MNKEVLQDIENSLDIIQHEISFWTDALFPEKTLVIKPVKLIEGGHAAFQRLYRIPIVSLNFTAFRYEFGVLDPVEFKEPERWDYAGVRLVETRYSTTLSFDESQFLYRGTDKDHCLVEMGFEPREHIMERLRILTDRYGELRNELKFLSNDLKIDVSDYIRQKKLYNKYLGIHLEK